MRKCIRRIVVICCSLTLVSGCCRQEEIFTEERITEKGHEEDIRLDQDIWNETETKWERNKFKLLRSYVDNFDQQRYDEKKVNS